MNKRYSNDYRIRLNCQLFLISSYLLKCLKYNIQDKLFKSFFRLKISKVVLLVSC